MIRTILFFLIASLILIVSIPYMLFQLVFRKICPMASQKSSQAFICFVFRAGYFVCGIKEEVYGKENIPTDEPVLYVPNHRSIFDALCTLKNAVGPTCFVAKKSTKKIPLLSIWMYIINCQFIDRSDIKQGLSVILKCIELEKKGISVIIFPEGTRNKNEDEKELLEFHEASFKIAQRSGCAIVPVAIHNTVNIFEAQFPRIKSTHITVEYGKPFHIEDLPKELQKKSGEISRKQIIEMLEKRDASC